MFLFLFIYWLVDLALNFQTTSNTDTRDFEMAQLIDKQITDVSFTINALNDGTKLGEQHPWGFDTT